MTYTFINSLKAVILVATLALLTSSCTHSTKNNQQQYSLLKPLDTLVGGKVAAPIFPGLFQTAFVKGTTATVHDEVLDLYGVDIGKLKLPSGKLIACDPMHMDEYGIPYTQSFPKGEFPVHLAIARLEQEEVIAFARILFSNAPVAKWDFAMQEGQNPLPIAGKKKHGYSVDAGVGIFIDEQYVSLLNPKDLTQMDRGIYTALDSSARNSWRYAMYAFAGGNAATFSTGLGDGYYASYIGYDSAGRPCQLLSDFEIFNWRKR